ncbi:hypothetical protein LINPERHAP1_LOCUS10750 [Linum perenne]
MSALFLTQVLRDRNSHGLGENLRNGLTGPCATQAG